MSKSAAIELRSADASRRRRWARRLLYLFVILLISFIGLAVLSWRVGGQLIAPAPRTVGPAPADFPCKNVSIRSESGSTLAGWFAVPENPRGVVVLLHGIRSTRLSMLQRARQLYAARYAVLLVDFQSHGESPGECITLGHLEARDARAAVEFARTQCNDLPIAVVGKSLGGAAALIASPLNIDALVIESVYPTIEEATSNRLQMRLGSLAPFAMPLLSCQLGLRLGIGVGDLQPIGRIKEVGCPILVISGCEDRHTTMPETKRLFGAAREPKQLLLMEGAAHQDLERFDPTKYQNVVLEFLDTFLDRSE
ncbi:MAG: alpha/beta fold hydrolase [Pirellulales bacterium]